MNILMILAALGFIVLLLRWAYRLEKTRQAASEVPPMPAGDVAPAPEPPSDPHAVYFADTDYRIDRTEPTADPNRDHWEGAFWDVESPRNLEAHLRLDYRDGAGSRTTRDITLKSYGAWEGGGILFGHCHLRNANRTFRTDRILSSVDLESGEVIDDLESWLNARYEVSPERAIEVIMETAWDALRVLYYVSKADGRLTQKERAILREAVRSMSDHPAIDDKRIDGLIGMIDITTLPGFKQAFGRLIKRNRSLAGKVVAWSEAMVATEKTIASAEQEAVEYLKARFSGGAAGDGAAR